MCLGLWYPNMWLRITQHRLLWRGTLEVMVSVIHANIPTPDFFLRSRVKPHLIQERIDLIIWTTSCLNIPDVPNSNYLLNQNHLMRNISLPLIIWRFHKTLLGCQVEWKRKAEDVVGITKKTFKLFLLKVSTCVIRILLTKIILTKKIPKVDALTKVSICVIWN